MRVVLGTICLIIAATPALAVPGPAPLLAAGIPAAAVVGGAMLVARLFRK
jgi:hypothetical protein